MIIIPHSERVGISATGSCSPQKTMSAGRSKPEMVVITALVWVLMIRTSSESRSDTHSSVPLGFRRTLQGKLEAPVGTRYFFNSATSSLYPLPYSTASLRHAAITALLRRSQRLSTDRPCSG